MVLKIEENATSVLVIKNESLLLQRNIGFGFLPAIREIMHQPAFQAVSEFDARNIAMKRACIRKTLNEGTVITDNEDMPEPTEGQAMTNARQAVTDSLEDLVKGIQRVLNYYNSTNSSNPLDLCYVCGAGGSINGISHLLSNELGLKVSVLRKLENVSYSVLGDNADLYNYVASIGAIYAPVGFFSRAKANRQKNATNYGKLIPLVSILGVVVILALLAKGFLDYKAAKDRNDELLTTVERYQQSEEIYKRYAAVLAFYKEVRLGEASTQRSSDNIADFLEELEAKMPTNMTISKFETDDSKFTMDVQVLDRNTAIGCIETLRTLDTVSGVSLQSIEEKESRVSEEELEDLKAMGFVAIDETEPKDAKNDKDKDDDDEEEEEAILVIEGNENADDTALTVKHIGTYYLRYDSESGEKYYVRKYVSFTISCVYAPAEEIKIENNVTGAGEVAE
jgi:type IV pilus assembly protein PilM